MDYLPHHSRVIVTDPSHSMFGKTGTVHRKLHRDNSAWIAMDEPLPDDVARFSHGDPRRDHVILWPDQCEAREPATV